MLNALKYIAVVVVCITIMVVLNRFESCGSGIVNSGRPVIVTPKDSNFAPVVIQNYRPPSLPFSKRKLPIELPNGVDERDVSKVTTIGIKDVAKDSVKIVDIVETKSGETFVMKDSSIVSITVTTVEPPIFVFNPRVGVGVTLSLGGGNINISPSVSLSPFEWLGWLHAPTAFVDKDGVAIGAEVKIYHEIFAGVARFWRFDGNSQVKLTLSYDF